MSTVNGFKAHKDLMKQIALDIGLSDGPTFDNFLAGPNEAALQYLSMWIASETRSPVPIYLWGESNSGKTHLLQAIAKAEQTNGGNVGWMDQNTTEPPVFNPAWRLIVLDDVHAYGAVQQQMAFAWFVHAVTPLDGLQRGIIAAGHYPPMDLTLREDLRTRLGWGHVFQLKILKESQRRSVLRQQADERGIFISDEVMDYMLNRFARDLSSLIELLHQLDGYALQTKRPITIPLLKSMLEDL